jgi:DNA-binding MarR family transcriptional regulator
MGNKPGSRTVIEAYRQENIGRLFLRAHRDFSVRAVEKLHAHGHSGLTLAHTTLLSNLDTTGTHISTLAKRAGMTKQSMGQLVNELDQRGYVECIPDPEDKRATVVKFTAAGQKFLEDAYEVKREMEVEYIAILGEEQFRLLTQMLNTILEHSTE